MRVVYLVERSGAVNNLCGYSALQGDLQCQALAALPRHHTPRGHPPTYPCTQATITLQSWASLAIDGNHSLLPEYSPNHPVKVVIYMQHWAIDLIRCSAASLLVGCR